MSFGRQRTCLQKGGMLSNGTHIKSPHHYQSPPLSESELERDSFRPQVFEVPRQLISEHAVSREKFNFWKGHARNMQGFKAFALDINWLGENMPNIKLWSDIAPFNINKVLPYESILCLSNFTMGKDAIIIPRC